MHLVVGKGDIFCHSTGHVCSFHFHSGLIPYFCNFHSVPFSSNLMSFEVICGMFVFRHDLINHFLDLSSILTLSYFAVPRTKLYKAEIGAILNFSQYYEIIFSHFIYYNHQFPSCMESMSSVNFDIQVKNEWLLHFTSQECNFLNGSYTCKSCIYWKLDLP